MPSIYAVGDVTNRVQLTPVAIREGQAFADTVFGNKPTRVDYHCIPAAVFSHPQMAGVGMTESQAKMKHGSVKVYLSDFRPMKNVLANRNERALYKMICDGETGKILGIHMIGPEAAEILQAAAVAVKAGLTKDDFDATVALHPTMAEELVLMKCGRPGFASQIQDCHVGQQVGASGSSDDMTRSAQDGTRSRTACAARQATIPRRSGSAVCRKSRPRRARAIDRGFGMARQHDDVRLAVGDQPVEQRQAVHARHRDVHRDDRGPELRRPSARPLRRSTRLPTTLIPASRANTVSSIARIVSESSTTRIRIGAGIFSPGANTGATSIFSAQLIEKI